MTCCGFLPRVLQSVHWPLTVDLRPLTSDLLCFIRTSNAIFRFPIEGVNSLRCDTSGKRSGGGFQIAC